MVFAAKLTSVHKGLSSSLELQIAVAETAHAIQVAHKSRGLKTVLAEAKENLGNCEREKKMRRKSLCARG